MTPAPKATFFFWSRMEFPLPPGEFGGDSVEKLFCGELNCDSDSRFAALKDLRVSAHFFIRRDGALVAVCFVQIVAHGMRANRNGAGEKIATTFPLARSWRARTTFPYAAAQYQTFAALFFALQKKHPEIKNRRSSAHCARAQNRPRRGV